jgi:hypothetical protein
MTDLEHELRAAMHEAVDAERGFAREMVQLVRRRHRRHNVLLAVAAAAAVVVAPAAAVAVHVDLARNPPSGAAKRPRALLTELSGVPMPVGINLQLLDASGAWFSTADLQNVTFIQGLPTATSRLDAFARAWGGWVAWAPVSAGCRTPGCAGPSKEFYFFADGAVRATPIGAGYAVASASQRGALWLLTYPQPGDDVASTSANAELVSTDGHQLGLRYRLPAGYLLDRGVGEYLLLTRHGGVSVLWDPRTGQTVRRFPDVFGAGPEQIIWSQGCARCKVQILNALTGQSVRSTLAGHSITTPQPVLSDDGDLLAVRTASGVSVLDTSTGVLTAIPGTDLNSSVWFKFGWLAGSHRLIVIAGPNPATLIPTLYRITSQLGYWDPGDTRLTVAPPGWFQDLTDILP